MTSVKMPFAWNKNDKVVHISEVMEKIRQELENWYTEFLMKHFSPEGRK